MDSLIESFIIEAIKNPTLTFAVMSLALVSTMLTRYTYSKLNWMYRREKFYKQLELTLYKRKF